MRRASVVRGAQNAATLEMLMGRWIIMEFIGQRNKDKIVYYRWDQYVGETDKERKDYERKMIENLKYFLDFARRNNLMSENASFRLRTLDTSDDAATYFGKAKNEYIDDIVGSSRRDDWLYQEVDNLKLEMMDLTHPTFSAKTLGMRND